MTADAKVPVFGGLLEAKAKTELRDWIAGLAAHAMLSSDHVITARVGDTWVHTDRSDGLWRIAYAEADKALEVRADSAAANERQARLAAIGELAVRDGIVAIDSPLVSEELRAALEVFVAEAKVAQTLPPPAGDDSFCVPEGAADPVFTSATGDNVAGYTVSAQVGTASDGTPVITPGRKVGADRGAKDEGESK